MKVRTKHGDIQVQVGLHHWATPLGYIIGLYQWLAPEFSTQHLPVRRSEGCAEFRTA